MNIRMPGGLSEALLSAQDEYLKQEREEKGVVTLAEIPTVPQDALVDKLSLWQGDITRLQIGAIVNAANSQMLGCFVPCHRWRAAARLCRKRGCVTAGSTRSRWEPPR